MAQTVVVGDDIFVGRAPAIAGLRAGLDGAVGGRGGLVLVAGEAGIGKTALAVEAARSAVDRGAEVLWATCWPGDGAPAYWPWVQLLREHERSHGPLPSAVARILPGDEVVPTPLTSGSDDGRSAFCSSMRSRRYWSVQHRRGRCCWSSTTCSGPTSRRCE